MVHCHWRAVAASVVAPQSFSRLSTSSLSRMLNCGFSPSAAPSSRSSRTPSAWKVQISTSPAALPTRPRARSRISAAALLVKVMAAMRLPSTPVWIRRAILCVMTRVLPEPAPASTRQGPRRWLTASCWARLREAVMQRPASWRRKSHSSGGGRMIPAGHECGVGTAFVTPMWRRAERSVELFTKRASRCVANPSAWLLIMNCRS